MLTPAPNTSIRGMSIPLEKVIWMSGSNGTVGKSVDAGATWKWLTVPGYEKRDFRDIEAFDSNTAIIMAIDNPACILKTADGGKTWRKTFEKNQQGMFLDAMDFKNKMEGICIGDPLPVTEGSKAFYIIRTSDGGETWTEPAKNELPPAHDEEGVFAASGTNISFLNNRDYEYAFVTGGKVSYLYFMARKGKKNRIINIPVNQGPASAGAFSLATGRQKEFYCIGGDYKQPGNPAKNFSYAPGADGPWLSSTTPPAGFRSCIRIIDNSKMVACGTSGIDLSDDGGKNWRNISRESFNVCMVSRNKTIFFAGDKGSIAKLVY